MKNRIAERQGKRAEKYSFGPVASVPGWGAFQDAQVYNVGGGGVMKAKQVLADAPKTRTAPVMDADDELSASAEVEIARLAYSYWEARGCQGGSPWEDWFRAEQELIRRREL
jgi:hypothetical protein